MPFNYRLPARFAAEHWKAKIYDKESGLEPPHVTLLHKARKWRFDLRRRRFMDSDPSAGLVPREIVEKLREDGALLRREWNQIHPHNPV